MAQTDPNIEIWAGSGSFFPLTFTPFGFYDNDSQFQEDAESTAKWAALRLGYPITDVELNEINFYSAFEEAVNEYGAQVNFYQARDNLINLQGFPTGSSNLSGRYIPQTLRGIFRMAKAYGSEVGAGGTQTYYTGSLSVTPGKQVYNLLSDTTIETGSFATDQFTLRKIFHQIKPASIRYNDPAAGTLADAVTSEFGWNNYTLPGTYMLMPIYYDVLRMQQIEFNDQIRKSGYSFQLTGNRLRIFPIPNATFLIWFNYTLDAEGTNFDTNGDQGSGKISDISNIPYQNITYKYINEIGRQWIRRYTLAICKEMLGYIRSKYSEMPIPDGSVTLNGSDLVSAAATEKEALMTELKDVLDSTSIQSQLERKGAVAEAMNKQLSFVPLKFYVR
tara:strand:+ start:7857 stop:9026 length:1170 start_codon:yes stop_codon:yes gene_type:complete